MFTSPLKSFCPGLKHRVLCFTFDMSQAKSESRKSLQLITETGDSCHNQKVLSPVLSLYRAEHPTFGLFVFFESL